MIQLTKTGNAIKFIFDENDHYLYNGTIEVPVNSLTLVTDESGMFTFKKSATNDIFISGLYSEIGMTKAELETFYKENMVGSTGGGGGTTPEEVQEMIDESISGLAESSAVTLEISEATSGKVDADSLATVATSGSYDDLLNRPTIPTVPTDVSAFNNDAGYITSDALNGYATEQWVGEQGYLTEHQDISGKQDVSGMTAYTTTAVTDAINSVLTAHTANTEIHVTSAQTASWNAKSDFSGSYNDLTDKPTIPTVPTDVSAFNNDAGYITEDALNGYAESSAVTAEITAAVSGKQDTLVSGTNIKTINNESILGSGNITIQGGGGSGNPTVELTQAEYDALVSAGTVSADTYYIITDATPVDVSNYWTSAQTQSAITQATSGKVNTSSVVTAVTSGSTDNEIPTAKAVYDAVGQGGGGGTTYTAGRGIDITNDTISVSLPISAGTGTNSIVANSTNNKATKQNAIAIGQSTSATSNNAFASGWLSKASGAYSHAEGRNTKAVGDNSHTEGCETEAKNRSEHASGHYNNSVSASTTFGDSGNTLFSVGNGTADNARHNAFEIRQNGDIYLTKDGQDVKLQDQLGGGTVDQTIISGSTNAVAGGAVYSKIDEVEQVTAAALNTLNDAFGGLKLMKISQTDYNNLQVKDQNTLYIIVN